MKSKLPRKKKKKAKKKMALLLKKIIPLIVKVTYDVVVLTHQIDAARLSMRMFIESLSPYDWSEPITRCDRLITTKLES